MGGSGPVDMTITGEGCQPITDLGWKKKENKYLGQSSLSDREVKDLKEMGKRPSIEQFTYKFPDNEKHLGLENVSDLIKELFSFVIRFENFFTIRLRLLFIKLMLNLDFSCRIQIFATSIPQFRYCFTVGHSVIKY